MDFVIVEDHEMILQLLQGVLETIPGLHVAATARTVAEGVKACVAFKPAALILDLGLPDGDGVTVAREAVKANPATKIIILSGHAATLICPRHLQPSVHAIVEKKRAYSVLEARVRELVQGEDGPTRPRISNREELLSRKELRIFELIGAGRSNKQIADALKISENTVKTHRRNIASKLGVHGAELIQKGALFLHKFQNQPKS